MLHLHILLTAEIRFKKGGPMVKLRFAFSFLISAALNFHLNATTLIFEKEKCIDTYFEVTSPNKVFEGTDKTLAQV